jgi:ABC-type antimicrobial peptide transport system permease subunit
MLALDLALRSLRFRASSFVASFLAVFLRATLVMAFASMLDTAGYLASENLRRRTQQPANALMPIIILVATTGTLYMQSIENGAPAVSNSSITAAEARNLETLNYVVVGIFAAFAAIVLVNTLVAATTHRRQEFGQLRLAGSTRPQVFGMVSLESVVLLVTGVVFGSVAAVQHRED